MDLEKFEALQEKTKTLYQKNYSDFKVWLNSRGLTINESSITEYINQHCVGKSPSTAWSLFSMLRITIIINDGINIREYKNLIAFLRKNSEGHPKVKRRAPHLKDEDVERFLKTAPDYEYLASKVILVMGVCGGLSRDEIYNLRLSDLDERGDILIVKSFNLKEKRERMFAVTGDYFELYKKYAKLRPEEADTDRFFMKYGKGKCARQVIGVNRIGQIPRDIAHFLDLPEPNTYNGNAFRWTNTSWGKCKVIGNTRKLTKEKKDGNVSLESNQNETMKSFTAVNVSSEQIFQNLNPRTIDPSFTDVSPASPPITNVFYDNSYVDPLTRDDLKDHISEVNKSSYVMGKICAACKWSIRLYYNLEEQHELISNRGRPMTNLSSSSVNPSHPHMTFPQNSNNDSMNRDEQRYLEPGPHFSPTFTAGDNQELKWEVRLDCRDGKVYVRLHFRDLKSTRYDYKISYLQKDLQEQVIRDFSQEYSNNERTRDCVLPKDLHLRFAKSTLVLVVRIIAEIDHLNIDQIKMEIDDEEDDDIVSLEDEVSEESQELEAMFESGLLSDVTLYVEEQSIPTHKNILAARSKVFLEMFTNSERDSNSVIEIDGLKYDTARKMMSFFYTGHLRDLEEESAKQMLVIASKYEIKLLFPKCEAMLSECLSVSNVVELYKLAETYSAPDLKAKAKEFLVKNIKNVKEDLLKTLNSESLAQILLEVTKRQN